MVLEINGEKKTIDDGHSISTLLVAEKVEQPDMVSIQYNGAFLTKESYDSIILHDGDSVDFLYFMGGGAA